MLFAVACFRYAAAGIVCYRSDRGHNVLLLLDRQLGKQGKCQGFARSPLAYREVARRVSQAGEALLDMQRLESGRLDIAWR